MLPITLTTYLLLFLLSPKYGYTYEPSTISKETLCQLGITTYVIIGANIGTFTIVSTIFRWWNSDKRGIAETGFVCVLANIIEKNFRPH